MTEEQTNTTLPIGDYLPAIVGRGEHRGTIQICPTWTLVRPVPFYADPQDRSVAFVPDLYEDPAQRASTQRPVELACISDVTVTGFDGLMIRGGKVLADSADATAGWLSRSNVANVSATEIALKAPVPEPIVGCTSAVMGFVGTWSNYAHWITECLPRISAFLSLRRGMTALKIALPAIEPASPQAETLRLLGVTPDMVLTVRDDETVSVARLWCLLGIHIWAPPAICRAAALALSAAIPVNDEEAAGRLPARIYIERGSNTRKLVNFDELRPIVEYFGFSVLRMQALDITEQVRHMRNARLVVGENSGGLANALFCPGGARILELNNPAFVQPAHWSIAALIGGGFGFCVGSHAGEEAPTQNSDYALSPARFAVAISRLVNERLPAADPHGALYAAMTNAHAHPGMESAGRLLAAQADFHETVQAKLAGAA